MLPFVSVRNGKYITLSLTRSIHIVKEGHLIGLLYFALPPFFSPYCYSCNNSMKGDRKNSANDK